MRYTSLSLRISLLEVTGYFKNRNKRFLNDLEINIKTQRAIKGFYFDARTLYYQRL